MDERLKEGDECLASRGGLKAKYEPATVVEVLPRGYRVRIGNEVLRCSESKVRPKGSAKRTPLRSKKPESKVLAKLGIKSLKMELTVTQDAAKGPIVRSSIVEKNGQPVPKEPEPEKCPAYLDFIRRRPCCNCGENPQSDPHHEGKRGVGQKVRDTLTVPLCRTCHRIYTDTNCLPELSQSARSISGVMTWPPASGLTTSALRSRGDSLRLLHQAQDRCLKDALGRLPPDVCRELLSQLLARMDQQVLADALRGSEC